MARLETPVVLIIFKRPELTRRALAAIAAVRPRMLLVVADGPRAGRPDEQAQCDAARAVIAEGIDWNCTVATRYSSVNLGCGIGPATGISWAFSLVDRAIVVEDDCVPHPTFFRFCEEMLERYVDDERVMHVCGSTQRQTPIATQYSYFFSQFNIAAGSWATWKRGWQYFDPAVPMWPALKPTQWLQKRLRHPVAVAYWEREFDTAYERRGNVSYWDHQWTFACWLRNGLSVSPRCNLASNAGGGEDATHMLASADPILHLPVNPMAFPLRHPPTIERHRRADQQFLDEVVLPRLSQPSRLHVIASRVAPEFVKTGVRRFRAGVRRTHFGSVLHRDA